MCWALSDGSSKLIPIDEQPNHQIVHLFRLRKAKGATHKPLHPGPEIGLRSWRRPLSATQHNPTTSLISISFHCNETGRFESSILTTFVTTTH
jgi:hypothetical protein